MDCTTCGRPVEPGARSCRRCGAPVLPGASDPQVLPAVGGPPYADRPYPRVLPYADQPDAASYAGSPPYAGPHPYATPPPEPGPRRVPAAPLIAAAVLLVLAMGGTGWLLATRDRPGPPRAAAPMASTPAPSATPSPTPSSTPSTDPVALAQVQALDALLDRSAQSKDTVGPAVTALTACATAPAQAQQVFQAAASGRRALLDELAGTPLDALPEGPVLRTELAAALQGSAQADDAFAAWAAAQAAACTPDPAAPDLVRGLQLSTDAARPAKERFVAAWNPVAARSDLLARDATDL